VFWDVRFGISFENRFWYKVRKCLWVEIYLDFSIT
jgi:hypothetical protein